MPESPDRFGFSGLSDTGFKGSFGIRNFLPPCSLTKLFNIDLKQDQTHAYSHGGEAVRMPALQQKVLLRVEPQTARHNPRWIRKWNPNSWLNDTTIYCRLNGLNILASFKGKFFNIQNVKITLTLSVVATRLTFTSRASRSTSRSPMKRSTNSCSGSTRVGGYLPSNCLFSRPNGL